MPLYLTSDDQSFHNDRAHTSEPTAGLRVGGGVESCRRRLDTGDATDRVGVTAPIEGAKERATEGLLLAREIMLVSENASCKFICEVFRISLPESLMRGLNIAITCCKVEFGGIEAEDTKQRHLYQCQVVLEGQLAFRATGVSGRLLVVRVQKGCRTKGKITGSTSESGVTCISVLRSMRQRVTSAFI
jgi:hypothetical protein